MCDGCRLEEVGAAATKEYSLEKAMEKMTAEWEEMEFVFIDYRDTVRLICSSEIVVPLTLLSTVRASLFSLLWMMFKSCWMITLLRPRQ